MWSPARHRRPRGQPRPAKGALTVIQRQARSRRWLTAAIIGGILGFIGGRLLGSWIVILLLAAAIALCLLAWDRRTATLTGWWPGEHGDAALIAQAARLEKSGWHVLIRPAVPGMPDTAALLLIGPPGVVVVVRQVWALRDHITTDIDQGRLLVRGQPASRRVGTVRAITAAVHEALTDRHPPDPPVHGVLAVRGTTLPGPHSTIGVTVLPIADLTHHLRRQPPILSPAETAALAATARRLFIDHQAQDR